MPDSTITLRTRADTSGIQQYAQSAEQLIIELRASAIAAGQSEAKFLELAGALSLQALKTGDAVRADRLLQEANKGLAVSAQQASSAALEASTKAERAIIQEATARGALARAQDSSRSGLTGLIQAEKIYTDALNKINPATLEAIRLQTQLASVQNQVATGGRGAGALPRTLDAFGTQAIDQFKAGLLGIVGPAAIVATAMGGVKKAFDLTEESFKLKAALDTTNLSIQLQLKNFRDVNQTLQEGRQFADRYAITQGENADAIQASIPILRQSKASLTDVEGVLSRLSVLKPEQGIRGAAFALAELEGGQSKSLATRFNIPIAKANELRDAIRNGGDAVQVMGQYLDSIGIDMSTLDTRTQGATGKMNQLKVETENFQLALGGQAGGPGLALLETRIQATRGATRLLSGDFVDFGKGITDSVAQGQTGLLSFFNVLQPVAQGVQRLAGYNQLGEDAQRRSNQALQDAVAAGERKSAVDDEVRTGLINLTNALSKEEQEKLADKIETQQLAAQQTQLASDSALAAQGLLGAGDQALILAQKYGIAADQAQFLIRQQQGLSNATALADQRVGERDPNNTNTAAQSTKFGKLARQGVIDTAAEKKKADDKAAQDAQRLNDLTNQNRLINASTSAAKIRELERQKSLTTDVIKRQELQNQIDQERQSKGRAGAAGGKGLGALDRVDISLAGDYQAQLDAVNAKLAAGHLTELQTKQLKKEALDLQKKIADETDRAANASLDARIAAIEDRKARRQEDRQLAGAQRRLNSAEFSPEEKAAAQDVIELTPLQQEKRARDIAAKAREGGIDVPTGAAAGANAPLPGSASPPPAPVPPASLPTAASAPAPIIIEVDGKEIGRIAARFLQSGRNAAALRG